ncbi:MAG TPA: hypothetical protein VIJ95_00455 [Hanamia sp.]
MKIRKLTHAFYACIIIGFITWGCQKREATPQISNVNDTTPSWVDSNLYTLSGPGGQDTGQIFLSLNTNSSTIGNLLILDQKGYVIREKTLDSRADDFQKWVINGQTRYSYLLVDGSDTTGGPLLKKAMMLFAIRT